MTSTRSSNLMKIMRIEEQVKRVNNDLRYRHIQENVKALRDNYGKAIVDIANPEDMEKRVTVRKNSEEAKAYLKTYELMLLEYDVLMNELRKEKKRLSKELF